MSGICIEKQNNPKLSPMMNVQGDSENKAETAMQAPPII
jgi:hypothetical protein